MQRLGSSRAFRLAKTFLTTRLEAPAFSAGIGIGSRIDSVNSQSFTPQNLRAAVECADTTPLMLGIQQDGQAVRVPIPYRGKLAYPHLLSTNKAAPTDANAPA
jgi:hypothetical protein